MVEQNDPNNIEAIFYSAYGKAKTSLISDDIFKRQAAFKVLKNCISIIDDKYRIEDKKENEIAIKAMAYDLLQMFESSFVYTKHTNGYGIITTNKSQTYELYVDLIQSFYDSMLNIESKDPEVYMFNTVILFLKGCKKLSGSFDGYNKSKLNELYDECIEKQTVLMNRVRKQKLDAYWASHKEEKEKLDQELLPLQETKKQYADQIAALQKKKEEVPAFVQLNQIKSRIEKLQADKKALGLFKSKEKQAIQSQIDDAEKEKAAVAKQAVVQQREVDSEIAPVRAELNKVIAKIKEIENELTKDR